MIPKECKRLTEDRPDCYWPYVVTSCASTAELHEPIKDPTRFPWNEVTKVQHFWLDVNPITKPMESREERVTFGNGTSK